MRRLLILIVSLLTALPVAATEIVGALSQNRVSLTATFAGDEILIFGAVRRTAEDLLALERRAADEGTSDWEDDFDVVIVVEGPRQRVEVWRKERVAGIWMNVDSESMASVPSYYAIASTAPISEILSLETDATHRISPRQAIRAEQLAENGPDSLLYADALLRIRERSAQYISIERGVRVTRDVLFNVVVPLPANLIEGGYTTRMYLVRDGEVVSQYRTAILVNKQGLERWLYQLAHEQPLLYGLLALVIALVAGWGASALFRLIRQS